MDAAQRAAEDPRKRSWLERISARGSSERANGCLPEFFVVGPPRTGTSWLYEMLRGQVILPRTTKETRFFDTDFHRGLDWYRAHPRSYARTRNATRVADWLKAQRFDRLVAAIRNSPLRQFFLSGGRPFADPPSEFAAGLYELFRPEVEELETILKRDLGAWKSTAADIA